MSLPQTIAKPSGESQAPTEVFHWEASGLTPEWADTFVGLAQMSKVFNVSSTITQGNSKVTVVADETTLEIRSRNGTARGSVHNGNAIWKAVLLLLALGRHFTVMVVDDAGEPVSVRSLRHQTNLGFVESEFDSLAEQIGLINRAMAKDPVFAKFL